MVKVTFILTSVVPSVPTRLLLIEADGALSTPLPLSVLHFMGIQSYSYTYQRKVEADVEVTEDRTGDLSLRKPHASSLLTVEKCLLKHSQASPKNAPSPTEI